MLFESKPARDLRIASDGSRHASVAAAFAYEQDLRAERTIEELLERHLLATTSLEDEARRVELFLATAHFLVRGVGLRAIRQQLNTVYESTPDQLGLETNNETTH